MNVLLSRARSLLVLVGSFDFFQYQVQDAERRNVGMFQWSTLITTLAGWFTTGWARRIPAPSPRRR
jgi:hypothetical protein